MYMEIIPTSEPEAHGRGQDRVFSSDWTRDRMAFLNVQIPFPGLLMLRIEPQLVVINRIEFLQEIP